LLALAIPYSEDSRLFVIADYALCALAEAKNFLELNAVVAKWK